MNPKESLQHNLPTEIIPESLVKKVELLEGRVPFGAREIASAICATRWGESWWDRLCFLEDQPAELISAISQTDLSAFQNGISGVRGTPYYWLHFLSPLVAYRRENKLWRLTLTALQADPGIKTGQIKKRLPGEFVYSFWYSVGGDRLQDFIIGVSDANEYRADILGLASLEEYHQDPTIKLSAMLETARKNENLVRGDCYKTSLYYQLADQFIKPKYGHRLLRTLARCAPFLCRNHFIPIEDPSVIEN